MALRWCGIVIDSSDHRALADWWARALRWQVTYQDDDEAAVLPADATPEQAPWDQRPPELVFVPVPQGNSSQVSAEAQGSHG